MARGRLRTVRVQELRRIKLGASGSIVNDAPDPAATTRPPSVREPRDPPARTARYPSATVRSIPIA